jgi:hypothetical protein
MILMGLHNPFRLATQTRKLGGVRLLTRCCSVAFVRCCFVASVPTPALWPRPMHPFRWRDAAHLGSPSRAAGRPGYSPYDRSTGGMGKNMRRAAIGTVAETFPPGLLQAKTCMTDVNSSRSPKSNAIWKVRCRAKYKFLPIKIWRAQYVVWQDCLIWSAWNGLQLLLGRCNTQKQSLWHRWSGFGFSARASNLV